jgi:hypothetical protein
MERTSRLLAPTSAATSSFAIATAQSDCGIIQSRRTKLLHLAWWNFVIALDHHSKLGLSPQWVLRFVPITDVATAKNGAKQIIDASANWRFVSPLDMKGFRGNQPCVIDAVVGEVVEILNRIDPDPNLNHRLSG